MQWITCAYFRFLINVCLEALFRLAAAQAAFLSGPTSSELEASKSCSSEIDFYI